MTVKQGSTPSSFRNDGVVPEWTRSFSNGRLFAARRDGIRLSFQRF